MKDDVETMKKRMRSVLIAIMLLATLFLVTACSEEINPYKDNDADGYTISVRYDANGGEFTTGMSVLVDSYDTAKLAKNSSGNYELGLLDPNNSIRGTGNVYSAQNPGYYLVGWYAERTEKGEGYSYARKWNFEKDLYEVDASKTYTSSEPVVTLYAVWAPMFQINFVDVNTGEELGKETFNPGTSTEIQVPAWGDTGAMQYYKFPQKNGYTFNGAYLDQAKTQPLEGSFTHTGKINEETGSVEDHIMTVYVDMMEGDWFQISTVEQLQKNARPGGSYMINADLDFEGTYWPTNLTTNNFTGTIVGNGHKISNVKIEQKDRNKTQFGLFGSLSDTAKISDLSFENVTVVIEAGAMKAGTTFGLLAGSVSSKTQLTNVAILNGKVQIDAKAFFNTDDYAIGKLFGAGYANQIDISGIICEAINNEAGKLTITDNGNDIELSFAE